MVPAAACAGANPGVGGQFATQPGQLDFTDLNPAAAARYLAALLEGQAFALGIEAGVGGVARAWKSRVQSEAMAASPLREGLAQG